MRVTNALDVSKVLIITYLFDVCGWRFIGCLYLNYFKDYGKRNSEPLLYFEYWILVENVWLKCQIQLCHFCNDTLENVFVVDELPPTSGAKLKKTYWKTSRKCQNFCKQKEIPSSEALVNMCLFFLSFNIWEQCFSFLYFVSMPCDEKMFLIDYNSTTMCI